MSTSGTGSIGIVKQGTAEASIILNGKKSGEIVEMNGIPYTYVGHVGGIGDLNKGEIGFAGLYNGSHPHGSHRGLDAR